MSRILVFALLSTLFLASCSQQKNQHEAILPSPDFDIHVYFNLFEGYPYFMVYHKNQKMMDWSLLGFASEKGPSFNENMKIESQMTRETELEGNITEDDFWLDKFYNSITFELRSTTDPGILYFIDFRAFYGGMAFRYRFSDGETLHSIGQYESSEINLSSKEMNWQQVLGSKDSLSGDVLLPATFQSDKNFELVVDETGDEKSAKLSRYEESEWNFVLETRQKQAGVENNELATAWRVILITPME